jgi:hypothetical protein
MNHVVLVLFLLAALPLVYLDVCIKCYRFDTEGNWIFHYDTTTYEANVFDPRLHCGYNQPNVQGVFKDVTLKTPAEIQVVFDYPNSFYILQNTVSENVTHKKRRAVEHDVQCRVPGTSGY